MLIMLIVLSMVGGILKVYGSIIGGSKSVFVDAMTSIANTLSIVLILKFFRAGMEPPDKNHHYGHHRLILGGSISMLMLYSFVAGIVVIDIINTLGKEYNVSYISSIYATIALVPYGFAIYIAKKSYSIASMYASFTAIEFIESSISIATSAGGATINYLLDFIGAIALSSYLFYELVDNFREVVTAISDIAPNEIMEKIYEVAKNHGLEIERIRVRKIFGNIYHGDIVVRIALGTLIEDAHSIADSIEKELKKHGIDVIVHVEPSKAS